MLAQKAFLKNKQTKPKHLTSDHVLAWHKEHSSLGDGSTAQSPRDNIPLQHESQKITQKKAPRFVINSSLNCCLCKEEYSSSRMLFFFYFYWNTDCIELHSLRKNKFNEGKVPLHSITETLTSSKVGDSPIHTEKSLQQHLTDSETEPRYGMMLAQSMIPQHCTQLWMQLINNISKYQVTSNNNWSFSDIGNIIREEEEILLPSKVNTNEMLWPTVFFK